MMAISRIALASLLVIASASCKTNPGASTPGHGEASALRSTPADAKTFAHCVSAGASKLFEVDVSHTTTDGKITASYTGTGDKGGSSRVKETGIHENADEKDASMRLYAFGGLRMIITLDRTSTGFYPATIDGATSDGATFTDNLMCSVY
jgi:hypothetical protein